MEGRAAQSATTVEEVQTVWTQLRPQSNGFAPFEFANVFFQLFHREGHLKIGKRVSRQENSVGVWGWLLAVSGAAQVSRTYLPSAACDSIGPSGWP